ncbi:GPI ethanolamine phosphate transferase 2 isoform X2 [Diospyros lotus]|uniref:GPI ethanolamine phosphate transferase 2 isoform X2 n=1 Tax=Diospyros lotus TaxID=55363 RepID=UPI0022582A32|nr:GPI ethanolamine phosphate transferase 2 isoform X2 [Diospyros lotus]
MSSLTCTQLTLCTLTAILIQIIGLSLFVLGFFPVKPALLGVSGPESFRPPGCDPVQNRNVSNPRPDQLKSLYQELRDIPPSFDRLILMVIDGLPAEFVLGKDGRPPSKVFMEAMPYTQSLLANGMAVGYHARAAPPTVTMPRLKAMVSGAVGGFLDVAFNFNTQALLDDNVIAQFFNIGWKMVMLGDETWLKLFPGLFTRHDGVSSFFVKDTVEVDHNVSRHMGDELNRTDWNLLILHYLGLDHVGHIGGRSCLLMGPKLKEMDEVIKLIHLSSSQSQDNDQGRTLLMVVSDHGMTENGNHGGSSYEETDSLLLFVGLKHKPYEYPSVVHGTVYQVDIAPTLALLFGVPIPKNNVGVLISETFDSLTDDQRLRTLELNSWQLLRLLKAQLPKLSCGNLSCDVVGDDIWPGSMECNGSDEEIFCCLFLNSAALHKSWKLGRLSRSNSTDDYIISVLAYESFLRAASEWLSRRATYKPAGLLVSGVAAMVMSSVLFIGLLLLLDHEVYHWKMHGLSYMKSNMHKWHLDETFVLAVIFVLVLSMGSSSMVEEEQYVWHFLVSTLYLVLLRKTIQSLTTRTAQTLITLIKGQNKRTSSQIFSIILILVTGRVMRGWHQGGVNWVHLPDISKWLEQAGRGYVKSTYLISWICIICLGLYLLSLSKSERYVVVVIGCAFLVPGVLVLQHIINYQESAFAASSYSATSMAQIVYAILVILSLATIVALPWFMPVQNPKIFSRYDDCLSSNFLADNRWKFLLVGYGDITYVIGWAYMLFWCLLQLLLQQPINAMPIFLLLVQILATMCYCSSSGPHLKQWVEVTALYYLGMSGHFSLGNTNTLATIDVAGAFMGISSHSTLLSGILMFIITYASPMLALLSLVMYMSVKVTSSLQVSDTGYFLKMSVGFPCLVPLGLNSIILVAYTIVLLLMRNHLFVWSVFSPKYLYVCATTACVYIGIFVVSITAVYAYFVFVFRNKMLSTPYCQR